MAEHITDEEQLETLKRWWKENGTSLVIGVLLAVGGYFGWQAWQNQQQQAREEASALYEEMMESGFADPGQELTEQQLTKVNSIADELMANHSDSLYAHNAAMLLAKIAVEKNDLAAAESHLRWVLDNGPSDSVKAVANLRLGIVLYSQDKLDEALQLVNQAPEDSFISRYAEARGDIQLARGDREAARTAYQLALDNLLQSQSNRRDMIQMKINDIDSTMANPVPESANGSIEEAPVDDGDNNADVVENNTAENETVEPTERQGE